MISDVACGVLLKQTLYMIDLCGRFTAEIKQRRPFNIVTVHAKAPKAVVEGCGVFDFCRIKMTDQVQEAASRVSPDSARLADVLHIKV